MSDRTDHLEHLYPDEPIRTLPEQLLDLLPQDKGDLAAVERAAAAGWPTIEPILPHLLTWLQDLNWPVAPAVAQLLVRVGEPVVPVIRQVLAGDDDLWRLWVMQAVVAEMGEPVIRELRVELERVVAGQDENGASEKAAELLGSLRSP